MPTYIMLTSLTAQGVQTLKATPDRLREVNRDVEELGAKVLHQWATLGPYDFVNVVEAPDAATIVSVTVGAVLLTLTYVAAAAIAAERPVDSDQAAATGETTSAFSNTSSPSRSSTEIVSPAAKSPSSRRRASGFST